MNNLTHNSFLKLRQFTLSLILILFSVCNCSIAAYSTQDEAKLYPDFSFSCTQNETEFILKVKMSYWTGENDILISRAMVEFSNPAREESNILEIVPTDINGEAVFHIEKVSERLVSADNIFTFTAVFEGNQQYEPAEGLIELKPLSMDLSFIEIDSVKIMMVEAYEFDPEGIPIPLDATDVYFYVPRSFSLLPVGEEWFEEGSA